MNRPLSPKFLLLPSRRSRLSYPHSGQRTLHCGSCKLRCSSPPMESRFPRRSSSTLSQRFPPSTQRKSTLSFGGHKNPMRAYNRTLLSEQRRLQQLLTSEEIGDCKPSQLLRHIQQLLGDKLNTMDTTFLREMFLQRLPSNVRMVLTPLAGDLNLDQLAPHNGIIATPDYCGHHYHYRPAHRASFFTRLDEVSMQMLKAVNTFSRPPPSPARRQSTSAD